MKSLVRSILITIFSILILTWLLPSVSVANTVTLIIAGVVLALLNTVVRPILKILFLPINLITLGIFGWLINLAMLYLAMWLVPGFQIQPIVLFGIQFGTFWSVAVVSVFLSILGTFLGGII